MTPVKTKSILFSPYFQYARVLKFLIFLSGACGLIYEIAWLKTFGVIFGNTTYATSVVLSGFMLGLGLGAFIFGRITGEHKNPLKLYAILEAGIGIYAFATPVFWSVIQFLFVGIATTIPIPEAFLLIVKFALATFFLFVPAFLMGGTLPALAGFLRFQKFEVYAKIVPSLYALNTFGAVFGVMLCGFVMIPALGVMQTIYAAGITNLFVSLVAARLAGIQYDGFARTAIWWLKDGVLAIRKFSPGPVGILLRPRFILFAITGAIAMVFEVGWTRILALALGSSTYAFSVMLITFLVGIAVGSWIYSIFAKHIKANMIGFGFLHLLVGCLSLIALNWVNELPYLFIKGIQIFGQSAWVIELMRFCLCSLVMLPSTLFMGAAFNCFVMAQPKHQALEDVLGYAYFANTLGAILGAVLAGFILVPLLGIQMTLMGAACTSGIVALGSILTGTRTRHIRVALIFSSLLLTIGCLLKVSSWNQNIIASGLATSVARALKATRSELTQYFRQNTNLFYREGIESVVSVNRFKDYLQLRVNGKVDASNGEDVFNQYFLGHLPLFLKPRSEKILVIGFGSGSTNAAVALHPVKRIDTVEIEPSVIEASQWFLKINRNVLKDPRNKIYINDGRNFLLTTNQKYDVIISEPSNPWMAGVSNLFTLEHYRTMKKRLSESGVVCQWVQAYSMSESDLRMIIRTFASVFDQVNVWTAFYPDLLLLGSNREIQFDFETVKSLWENPEIRNDFKPFGIESPEGFFSGFWLNDSEARLLGAAGALNTDNHPYLEYSAPKYLYRDTFQSNFKLINSFRFAKYPAIKNLIPPPLNNPDFHLAMARGYISKTMLPEATFELRLASDLNADGAELLTLLGILEFKREDYRKAKEYFMQALGKSGERLSADFYYHLGMIYKRSGEWRDASQYFAKVLKLEPENVSAVYELANSYKNEKMHDLAIPLFQKVLISSGAEATQLRFDSTVGLLDSLSQTGTLAQQLSVLKDAAREYPHITQFRTALGSAYEFSGDLSKAREAFLAAVSDFPEEPSFYISLARIYEKLGQTDQMKRVTKALIKVSPSLASNPEILRILNR